jgi:hypothetical protein
MPEIHVKTETGSLYVFSHDGEHLLRSSTMVTEYAPAIEDEVVPVHVLSPWPPMKGERVRFLYGTTLRTTSEVVSVEVQESA